MKNWKAKLIKFLAKSENMEIQITPKKLKNIDLQSCLFTFEVLNSLRNLEYYYEEKKENELQREIATLYHNLKESQELSIEYSIYQRKVFDSENKKLKLIEILKIIEHGKADCIYESYWLDLLNMLVSVGVLEEPTKEDIFNKILDIFEEKGQQNE